MCCNPRCIPVRLGSLGKPPPGMDVTVRYLLAVSSSLSANAPTVGLVGFYVSFTVRRNYEKSCGPLEKYIRHLVPFPQLSLNSALLHYDR